MAGLKLLTEGQDGPIIPLPDIDKKSCSLLGPTALVVQGLMGILVILSLVYKRQRETSKRPWRIWLFDVSKQVVGQMFVHGVNVLISDLISHHSSANACVSYFLNILIDTTLGVALIYFTLHAFTYVLSERLQLKGFESGKYGNPPSFIYWLKQAATYVSALTTMKFIVLAIFALFPGLFKIGEWLLSWTWTGDGDALQVIFVMGLFPICMNILQFWLIDSIVKASNPSTSLELPPDSRGSLDREPLFRSDSDDDDDAVGHSDDIESQRLRVRSRSRSPSRTQGPRKASPPPSIVRENKSSGSNSPSEGVELYTYPQHRDTTPTSSSSSDSISSLSGRKSTKRRSPPSPLLIAPINQPAINSPQKSAAPISAVQSHARSNLPSISNTSTKNEWADSWHDADDWANRVGEEDWTGRRLEQTKENLHGHWASTVPSIQVGS
ncbi:hypothetical protein ONZ45_g18049 [Pleurotus djamor]|nr:hypothetical protein ONZ45_g18049 [Pleurotus djamor]